MKRILLLGIVLIILGANGALAAVCPDINFIKSFNISQGGAEVPRVAAGADRKVYSADVNGGFLKVYTSDGKFVQSKKFANISSVGVYGDTVFIGKARYVRGGFVGEVGIYDSSLKHLRTLGSGPGEFGYPVAIVSDGDKVFVADRRANLVKAFSFADGSPLFSISRSLETLLHVDGGVWTVSVKANEYYIASDAKISLKAKPDYVHENGTVMIEGIPGSLIYPGSMGWGDNDSLGYSALYVRLSDDTDPDSKQAGDEDYLEAVYDIPTPSGIAIHPVTGNVYVSDRTLAYDAVGWIYFPGAGVHVYNGIDGSFVMKYPITHSYINNPYEMDVASGIAIDAQGRVYITEAGWGSVEVYDDAGNYVCEVASTNGTVYQQSPAFTTDGRFVFATDSGLRTYSTGDFVEMDVTPASLGYTAQDCASSPASQTITVSNNGAGTMGWTATTDGASWLTLDTASGTLNGPGSDTISVSVDASGLGAGPHTANVTISSAEAGAKVVQVSVDMYGPPSLAVTQYGAPYDFLVNGNYTPSSKPITVNVTGDQTGLIGWSASLGQTWMSLSPTSGPSGTDTIGSVGINSGALGALSSGNFTGDIILSTGCASMADVTVPVSLEYYEGGTIEVTSDIADASFTITGPQVFSGSGTSATFYDVSPGGYTITFDSVQGYLTPAFYSLVLAGDETITFNGSYTDIREKNNIIVTMGEARKWSIDDEGKVFDEFGTALESFMISKSKNPSRGGKGNFAGGTVAASGDIDGDGFDDIVTVNSKGTVKAFTGAGAPIQGIQFFAFGGGGDVAVGDLDGDGRGEIIVSSGTDRGDEALVRVFSYSGGRVSDTGLYFQAYSASFGVNVSAGDIDGDGRDEILTTKAGTGGRELVVKVWEVNTGPMGTWSVDFYSEIDAGISFEAADITAGDIDADGVDEILVTRLLGRSDTASHVTAFEADGTQVLDFAGPATGIAIAAGDIDMDGAAEVVISDPGGTTDVYIYNADGTYRSGSDFNAYNNPNIIGATVTLGQTTGQQ